MANPKNLRTIVGMGARPVEMRRRIIQASNFLRSRTSSTDWDYKQVLRECYPGNVVYMDPPYRGVNGGRDNRYLPTINHHEFCEELDGLNQRGVDFIVPYNGRTGNNIYRNPLPFDLGLTHLEIEAGRSTPATLVGCAEVTCEFLYPSPGLAPNPDGATESAETQFMLW